MDDFFFYYNNETDNPTIVYVTVKLNLEGYNLKNLRYLQHGDTRQDDAEDAARFQAWKACLGK